MVIASWCKASESRLISQDLNMIWSSSWTQHMHQIKSFRSMSAGVYDAQQLLWQSWWLKIICVIYNSLQELYTCLLVVGMQQSLRTTHTAAAACRLQA